MTTTTEINLRRDSGNWLTGNVGPFEVQALVFDEGSQYGMPKNARISKLWVALPGSPRVVLYDYDRGDVLKDHLTVEGLSMVVDAVTVASNPVADCSCGECRAEVKW